MATQSYRAGPTWTRCGKPRAEIGELRKRCGERILGPVSRRDPTAWTAIARTSDEVRELVGISEGVDWYEGFLDPDYGLGRPLRVFVGIELGEFVRLVVSGEPGSPLTIAGLRDARLGDLVAFVRTVFASEAVEGVRLPADEAEALAYRPGQRAKLTDYHLERIAGLYAVAGRVAPNRKQEWIAEWLRTTPTRVSRWVAAAKERGFISEEGS